MWVHHKNETSGSDPQTLERGSLETAPDQELGLPLNEPNTTLTGFEQKASQNSWDPSQVRFHGNAVCHLTEHQTHQRKKHRTGETRCAAPPQTTSSMGP